MFTVARSRTYRLFMGTALAVVWGATLYGILESDSVALQIVLAASLLPSALCIHFLSRVHDEGVGVQVDLSALDAMMHDFRNRAVPVLSTDALVVRSRKQASRRPAA